ncbi:MAG: glycosyltransferase, partial [Parafilimonas sp.]
YDGAGTAILDAMNSNVPVITSGAMAMEEIAGDAALYAKPADISDIAAQMMMVYKDEEMRSQLIEKGKAVSRLYNWEKSTELLWQSIENTIE